MPVRTGYIRQVQKNPRHPLRTDIWLNDGWPLKLYVLETGAQQIKAQLMASLCEKSMHLHRAVTVKTMDGVFGERIVGVELVPAQAEGAA